MSLDLDSLLGAEAKSLLEHKAKVAKETLMLPSADYVDRSYALSDRPTPVLKSLQALFDHGRLRDTERGILGGRFNEQRWPQALGDGKALPASYHGKLGSGYAMEGE